MDKKILGIILRVLIFLNGNGLRWAGVDAGEAHYAVFHTGRPGLLGVIVFRHLFNVVYIHWADVGTDCSAFTLVEVDNHLRQNNYTSILLL